MRINPLAFPQTFPEGSQKSLFLLLVQRLLFLIKSLQMLKGAFFILQLPVEKDQILLLF